MTDPALVRRTLIAADFPFEIALFAGAATPVRVAYRSAFRRVLVVVGTLFDVQDGSVDDAIASISNAIDRDDYDDLTGLGGIFTVVEIDRLTGSLRLISDCLGARPCFFAQTGNVLFASSDVGLLSSRIPGQRSVDPVSVSQFLAFGYNASNHTLDPAVSRVGAAEVVCLQRGVLRRKGYGPDRVQAASIGPGAMAERVHAIASRSFRNWARQGGSLAIGLSGGFDSRYLAALSTNVSSDARYVNVRNMQAETTMAARVCEALSISMDVIHVDGPEWNHYAPEGAFHLRPDGFPVTKSVCRLVSRSSAGRRVVDGFLGDALIRGHLDNVLGAREADASGDVVDRVLHSMVSGYQWILSDDAQDYVIARAKSQARLDLRSHMDEHHAITAMDVFLRQRSYISNNFLQNLHEGEPCLPFLDPELIFLKRTFPHADFGTETYREIFRRYFPRLRDMPHSKAITGPQDQMRLMDRKSALALLAKITHLHSDSPVDRRRAWPRVVLSLMQQRHSYIPQSLAFWFALQEACDLHGLALELSATT